MNRNKSLVVLAGAFFASLALIHGYQNASKVWPPPVQKITADAPALSVTDAMKSFYMPPGYHLEVVASEPMVSDPIVMDQDADGRLYVVEMPAFALDQSMRDTKDPICRLVVLEDTGAYGDDGQPKRKYYRTPIKRSSASSLRAAAQRQAEVQ